VATVGSQGVQGEPSTVRVPLGEQGFQGDAATVYVGTVTTVGPTVAPDVSNSGTSSDAVLDFDLPRAAAVSVGATSTVGPADPAAVTDSGVDGDVVLDFAIPQGVQGDQGDTGPKGEPGIVISPTEPDVTDVLWADTSEEGDAVIPVGGLEGQSLVKASGSDYDATWEDRAATWTAGSGRGYGPVGNTTFTPTLNRMAYNAVYFPAPTVIDAVIGEVTTGGSAGAVIRLGIYAPNAAGEPDALIVDAGTAAADSPGVKVVTITPVTVSGLVFATVGTQVESSVLRGTSLSNHIYQTGLTSGSTLNGRTARTQTGVTGALPANAVPSADQTTVATAHLRVA